MIARLCLFLSIVTVSGAYAADDVSLKRQVEMLSQRVGKLERRLDAIESPEIKAAIQQAVGDEPPEHIRPLLAQLPPGTRYEEVQLFLKCRKQPSNSTNQ